MKNEDREKVHKIWKQNMRETMDLALDLVTILENFLSLSCSGRFLKYFIRATFGYHSLHECSRAAFYKSNTFCYSCKLRV